MKLKLTETVVDGAKALDRRHTIWDSEMKGFGLRVTPARIRPFKNGGEKIGPKKIQRQKGRICHVQRSL